MGLKRDGERGRAGSARAGSGKGRTRGYRPVSHFPRPPSRFPLPASRFPRPPSRFPLPASRFPLPPSRSSALRRDRRGTGGFFEEIPAFVVVVLSVSMFLVAAYTTYDRMGGDGELSGLQDDCRRICRAFRGYETVLEKGPVSREPVNGVFEAGKLDALNDSVLQRALNSPHPYNLTVRDLLTGRNWSFGHELQAGAAMTVRVSSAAVVAGDDGRHDPARLEVVMWL